MDRRTTIAVIPQSGMAETCTIAGSHNHHGARTVIVLFKRGT
jgi:hypothetical protein